MYFDMLLEQKIVNFIEYLGITSKANYFTCYNFEYPILGIFPLHSVTKGIVTKIGSGLSFVDIKEIDYDKNIIRIAKSEIVKFETKDWVILGFGRGYFITVEAKKKYYFQVAKVIDGDLSTVNFFRLKFNNFFDLVTDNNAR